MRDRCAGSRRSTTVRGCVRGDDCAWSQTPGRGSARRAFSARATARSKMSIFAASLRSHIDRDRNRGADAVRIDIEPGGKRQRSTSWGEGQEAGEPSHWRRHEARDAPPLEWGCGRRAEIAGHHAEVRRLVLQASSARPGARGRWAEATGPGSRREVLGAGRPAFCVHSRVHGRGHVHGNGLNSAWRGPAQVEDPRGMRALRPTGQVDAHRPTRQVDAHRPTRSGRRAQTSLHRPPRSRRPAEAIPIRPHAQAVQASVAGIGVAVSFHTSSA